MELALRPAQDADQQFLYALFAEVKAAEFESVGFAPSAIEGLLRMQFDAQERSYRAAHPNASFDLVLLDGAPVGRIYVDREGEALELIDIAVMGGHRGRGIGSVLLRELTAEADADGRPVRLHVAVGNPAIRLYKRFGFHPTAGDEVYVTMERAPGDQAKTA